MLQQAFTEKVEQVKNKRVLARKKDSEHLARFSNGNIRLRTFAQTHPKPEILKQLAEQLYQDVLR